jgi:hypothetical protein
VNRRNFFKGLCALAVAPLAAALTDGPEPTLDKGIIRKIEAQLTGADVMPRDGSCYFSICYVDKNGNRIGRPGVAHELGVV